MLIVNLILLLALKLKASRVPHKSEYEQRILKVIYVWLWLPIIIMAVSIALYAAINVLLATSNEATLNSNLLTIINTLIYLSAIVTSLVLPVISWIYAYVYYLKLKHQDAPVKRLHNHKHNDIESLREEVEQLKNSPRQSNRGLSSGWIIAFVCVTLAALVGYGFLFVSNTQKQIVELVEEKSKLESEVAATRSEAERVSRRNDELQQEMGELRSKLRQTAVQPRTTTPNQQPTDVNALRKQIDNLTPKRTSCSPDLFGGFTCTSY